MDDQVQQKKRGDSSESEGSGCSDMVLAALQEHLKNQEAVHGYFDEQEEVQKSYLQQNKMLAWNHGSGTTTTTTTTSGSAPSGGFCVPGVTGAGGGAIRGFTPPSSPSSSSSTMSSSMRLKFPSGLAQKIGYLQMVVQMLGNNSASSGNGQSSSFQQEQIGKLIDQLLMAARGMFLEQQQQQQNLSNQNQNPHGGLAGNDFAGVPSFPQQQIQMPTAFDGGMYQQQPAFHPPQQMPFQGIIPKSEELLNNSGCNPWMMMNSAANPSFSNDQNALSQQQQQQQQQQQNIYHAAAEGDDEEALEPRDSYELIELDAMEILAEHTHFCEICGKGFKRDANLRMHMRGHGDEYKSPAALARPKNQMIDSGITTNNIMSSSASSNSLQQQQDQMIRKKFLPKRYSCPYIGCKRNKQHKKFVPLKTVLCVKNHYRRSHCPKLLTCTRCRVKRFAVLADLKTHEKHCGREKWQCSCGTTFSRKDKLLGHISLFVGHRPLMMLVSPTSPQNPQHQQQSVLPVIMPGGSGSGGSITTNSNTNNNSSSFPGAAELALYNHLHQQNLVFSSTMNLNPQQQQQLNTSLDHQGVVSVACSGEMGANTWSPDMFVSSSSNNNSNNTTNNNCSSNDASGGSTSSGGLAGDNNNNGNGLAFLGLDFLDCKH